MKKNLFLLVALLCMGSFVFAQKTVFPGLKGEFTANTPVFDNGLNPRLACPATDLQVTQASDGTGNGIISSDTDPAYAGVQPDGFSYETFAVTGAVTLSLQSIDIVGFTDDFPYSVGDTYVLEIYADAGGAPGALVCTENFDAATVDPDLTPTGGAEGSFTLFPSGCSLAPGTYWFTVYLIAADANSPFWYWGTSAAGDGSLYLLDPTGAYGLPAGVVTDISGFVGPGDFNYDIALCESTGAITLVPTMTEWGLFLFGLVMVTMGLVFVYNKQRQLA